VLGATDSLVLTDEQSASLQLEKLPALAGAIRCLEAGIRGSIHETNNRSAGAITAPG